MALIRINADGRNPVLHGTDAPLSPVLNRALDTTGPVTIMLHGYKSALMISAAAHTHTSLHRWTLPIPKS